MMLQTGFGHASRKSTSCKGDIHKTRQGVFWNLIKSLIHVLYFLLRNSFLTLMSFDKKIFYKESTWIQPSVIYLIDICIWYYVTISCSRAGFGKIDPIAGCGAVNGKISLKKRLRTSANFCNFWPVAHLVGNRGKGSKIGKIGGRP